MPVDNKKPSFNGCTFADYKSGAPWSGISNPVQLNKKSLAGIQARDNFLI